jgi:hypothetical protein
LYDRVRTAASPLLSLDLMYSWKPSGDKVYSHICRISVLMIAARSLKGRTVKTQNSCTFQNFTQRSHLNSELQISHPFLPALSKSLALKYALWPSCPLTIFQAIQSPQKHGRGNLSFVERRTTKSTTTLKEISWVWEFLTPSAQNLVPCPAAGSCCQSSSCCQIVGSQNSPISQRSNLVCSASYPQQRFHVCHTPSHIIVSRPHSLGCKPDFLESPGWR